MAVLKSWPGVDFRGLVTSARVPVDILILLTQPHNKSYYSYCCYWCNFHYIYKGAGRVLGAVSDLSAMEVNSFSDVCVIVA